LKEGVVYRKTITYMPRGAYTREHEYHSHRFEAEDRARLEFIFSASYGGDICHRWMRLPDMPRAVLVRRYGPNLELPLAPAKLHSGGVQFSFEIEPEDGDDVRFSWTNPQAGLRKH
jgi:hypothetical protein